MKILKVGIHCPGEKVQNDYYYERFPEQKPMLDVLFEYMEKKERFIIQDGEDTALTVGIKAAQNVISEAEIDKETIDAVFYCSQTPEYMMPTNAVMIHKHLGLKKDCFCVDMNANCGGMTAAFNFAHQFLLTHHDANRVLLVGSEYHSKHTSKDCMFSYPILGDIGCAVIVEQSECNVLFSTYYTNSKNAEKMLFPKDGISKIYDSESDKHIFWGNTDGTIEGTFGPAIKRIEHLLELHNISKEQIALICSNQQTRSTGEFITSSLGIPVEKACYVGDKYGYTGSTAAFMSLYHGLSEINVGDYILFCSAGAGGTLNIVLFQHN